MSAPHRIQALSWQVANQIAAGEVIERPASVVKELLENALDAQAQHIRIDIGFGGLTQITVSDDGCGIIVDDLALAIAPHATSKLRELDDLTHIATLGFRGEALASIASVSRFSIESRPHDALHACGVRVLQGEITHYPCVRIPGTTVDVRDLFFNAPVRKKFLKTAQLEYLAIESVVKRVAFCEPTVALTLSHEGKVRLRIPAALNAQQQQQRLRHVLGRAFCEHAIAIDAKQANLHLFGWVSPPTQARSQQDKQWVYLNGRMIRDKLLLHALKLAYEGLLPSGRYPVCVLNLTMAPTEVDVNVHPTKHEVRFSEPRLVHDFIRLALRERLVEQTLAEVTQPVRRSSAFSRNVPELFPDWQCLNSQFVLVREQEQWHLIHMAGLQQDVRFEQLISAPLPWASRRLMMPLILNVSPELWTISQRYQQQLKEYGLYYELLEQQVSVQAIPRDLPGLDLRGLLFNLAQQQPQTNRELIRVLLQSDTWDVRHLSPEEQTHWLAHWRESRTHSRSLDELSCQEWLNV